MRCSLHTELPANDCFELYAIDKLHNGQPTNRDHKPWLQNFNFGIHPAGTVTDLVGTRHTIRAARILSGKTPADRSEIKFRSHCGFVYSAELLKPTEKRFSSCMRKWSLQNRLPRTWRLTNDHYVAYNRPAGYGRRFHSRATAAA